MSIQNLRDILGDAYIVGHLGNQTFLVVQAGNDAPVTTKTAKAAKVEAPVEDDADDDDTDAGSEARTRLEKLGIRALKAEAKEIFDADDLKGITKEDLVDALVEHYESDDATETDDDADDAEADDEEESESQYLSQEDFDEMKVAAVKAVLKTEGWTDADLKGNSKDEMVEAYLEWAAEDPKADDAPDDDDEDEDEDTEPGEDDDADDSDDPDEEDEELTEEDMLAMSDREVKALAKEYGVKVARGASKEDIVAAIMEQAGEDEDDDDEPGF